MYDLKFVDNRMEVFAAMDSAMKAWLHEAAGELEAQTKRNTPVDTGQLKSSWGYEVDEGKKEATIGSPLDNAIWNEFGTGQYALHGDGRKTPWKYKTLDGKYYTTTGKRPQRTLFNAFKRNKPKLQKSLEQKLKGLGK